MNVRGSIFYCMR